MWRVLLSSNVQDFLRKQDKFIEDRLRKGLEKLKCENPFHFLEHYEGKDYYKFRIGDYRALIDIDFQNKILKVQVLDKRGRIYQQNY